MLQTKKVWSFRLSESRPGNPYPNKHSTPGLYIENRYSKTDERVNCGPGYKNYQFSTQGAKHYFQYVRECETAVAAHNQYKVNKKRQLKVTRARSFSWVLCKVMVCRSGGSSDRRSAVVTGRPVAVWKSWGYLFTANRQ